jgi:iron complex transport system ATP-binding protein
VNYGKRSVLRGVSFSIRSGEIAALLGANGAGKSTLLRAVNGSVKTTAGKVLLNGRNINAMTRSEVARLVAVVAQENETKFPVTVRDFVLAGRFVHGQAFGWESEQDLLAANDAMRACGLDEFSHRMMNELSGGERQRVVLARAIAADTPLLLLDEPTANLDLANQSAMLDAIRRRSRQLGRAAIVITHDLNIAAEYADTVIILLDGEILAAGRPEEVLTPDNVQAAYGVKVLLDSHPVTGRVRATTVF